MDNTRCLTLLLLLLVVQSCDPGKAPADEGGYFKVTGQTMGSVYNITYRDDEGRNLKPDIDQLLIEINQDVSTYIDESTISKFNQSDSFLDLETDGNQHFLKNVHEAKRIFEVTGGAFDPTVMPLVNYWGFGYDGRHKVSKVDSVKVDSLLELVGFQKVGLSTEGTSIEKRVPGMQLDFSGCAKGYAIDAVGNLLEEKGIENYLVEIGRDTKAKGLNSKGNAWRIAISLPKEGAALNEFHSIVELKDMALATSGNYQNFYEVNGIKYSHTIHPKTGYPERNKILSASVFAPDGMTADAYATAFMVMGLEEAFALAERLEEVDAYFIYRESDAQMGVMATSNSPSSTAVSD